MFGSLAVNARAGLGSPYPRPLQSGDELQTAPASGAAERRIELTAMAEAPIRVVFGPQDDEFADETKKLFVDSDWKISATSDRMGYRLEGPVHEASARPQHRLRRYGQRQHSGAGQRPADRADAGSRHQRRLSQDRDSDFAPTSGASRRSRPGAPFRFKAISMAEAQAEARKFADLLRTLPNRLRGIENFDLNIEALSNANVAGQAVSAVDADTWQPVAGD